MLTGTFSARKAVLKTHPLNLAVTSSLTFSLILPQSQHLIVKYFINGRSLNTWNSTVLVPCPRQTHPAPGKSHRQQISN